MWTLGRSLLPLAALASSAMAQPDRRQAHPLADSSATQIMARVRSLGPDWQEAPWLVEILRQRDKPQPRAKLDALADSLAARVISISQAHHARPQDDLPDPSSSFSALREAGLVRVRSWGTPYPGTLDRLIRIQREAPDGDAFQTAPLPYFLCVPGYARGLAALREIAISTGQVAMFAMGHLSAAARSGGDCMIPSAERQQAQAVLRRIFDRQEARDSQAKEVLGLHAYLEGWKRP